MEVTLKLAYMKDSNQLYDDLFALCEKLGIEFEGYTEEVFKERKKAFAIKNIGATRMCPFAVLVDAENNPKIAWYTERKECTYERIQKDVTDYLSNRKV